jgi:hypothetical protein
MNCGRLIARKCSQGKHAMHCSYRTHVAVVWLTFLGVAIAGCVGTSESKLAFQFDAELSSMDKQLGSPAFHGNASVTLDRVGSCKAIFNSHWSSETAAAKGYGRVETATMIDFSQDLERAEHEMPHEDVREHSIERWAEHIRIVFSQPLPTQFLTARAGESKLSSEISNLDFLSIPVSQAATTSQVNGLIQDINNTIEGCQTELPNYRALNTPLDGSSESSFAASYSNLARNLSPRQARRFALALFTVLLPESCLSSDDLVRLTFFPVSPDRKGELIGCRRQLEGKSYRNVIEAANKARIEHSMQSTPG